MKSYFKGILASLALATSLNVANAEEKQATKFYEYGKVGVMQKYSPKVEKKMLNGVKENLGVDLLKDYVGKAMLPDLRKTNMFQTVKFEQKDAKFCDTVDENAINLHAKGIETDKATPKCYDLAPSSATVPGIDPALAGKDYAAAYNDLLLRLKDPNFNYKKCKNARDLADSNISALETLLSTTTVKAFKVDKSSAAAWNSALIGFKHLRSTDIEYCLKKETETASAYNPLSGLGERVVFGSGKYDNTLVGVGAEYFFPLDSRFSWGLSLAGSTQIGDGTNKKDIQTPPQGGIYMKGNKTTKTDETRVSAGASIAARLYRGLYGMFEGSLNYINGNSHVTKREGFYNLAGAELGAKDSEVSNENYKKVVPGIGVGTGYQLQNGARLGYAVSFMEDLPPMHSVSLRVPFNLFYHNKAPEAKK